MGVGLVVGVWVARYLGPEQFGQFSYALAFLGLFGALASLGLNGIVVRDIVQEPKGANEILAAAMIMQFVGGMGALGIMCSVIAWLRPEDPVMQIMVAILGVSLIFKASEVVKYLFEAQVQSRYAVWVENGVFSIMAGVKVILILMQASLMTFVWMTLVETGLVAVGLMAVIGHKSLGGGFWKVRGWRCRGLLKDSWPLCLSGFAIMIFMRIDQVMLGELVSAQAVGVYSAAVRISEVWCFLPSVVASSVFPLISNLRVSNNANYENTVLLLLKITVVTQLCISFCVMFFADSIVNMIYAENYKDSVAILSIHVWSNLFQALGIVSGYWMIYEGMIIQALMRNICGMITSLSLNFVLIPIFGGVGAAVSSLISVAVAYYFYDIIFFKTRKMFYIKTKALSLGIL